MKRNRIPAVLLMTVLTGCATDSQIRSALNKNPNLIFDVIAKNPERFMDVATAAHAEAERLASEKKLDEEFRHPRAPQLDPARAYSGPADAPITIVEYTDFQCPYCQMGSEVIHEIRQTYDGKVRLLHKELPLSIHPQSVIAAEMFEAIALQSPEKAYAYYDALFERQDDLADKKQALLDELCKKVGANVARAKKDMASDVVQKRLAADKAEADSFGFTGTPMFLINGIEVQGAQPTEEFAKIIDRILQKKAT